MSWVAQSYLDIANRWDDWDFFWAEGSFTTTPPAEDYTLPADSRRINEDNVTLTNDDGSRQRLHYLFYEDYRRQREFYVGSGRPNEFTILPNGALRLLNKPDKAYVIEFEYWKAPTPLTENVSTPEFAEIYHDTIVWKACMYWAGFNEAEAEFQKFAAYYGEALLRLEARYLQAGDKYHARASGVDLVTETI